MAYFPNSTVGEVLDIQCGECRLPDNAPCPVLLVQMEYNYSQHNKGNEIAKEILNHLIDEEGICQMKPLIDQLPDSRRS